MDHGDFIHDDSRACALEVSPADGLAGMRRHDHSDPAAPDVDEDEARRELQSALDEAGATSMHMCATGEISPDAMRAIAASIRSLKNGVQAGSDRLSIPSEGRL